ncbi:MAG TPA: DUF4878 domain-containing protein [Aquifex aeolicus]|nr:DUF4878 domain-containing protein [Aquifex aeolicus]
MRKAFLLALGTLFVFGIKSCGEPYGEAQDVVEEFMEEVRDREGASAIRFLHPSYRDSLTKDLSLPIQFTEMRPSEVLACLLSAMGSGINSVEVKSGKLVGSNTALIKVKVEDDRELEKLFTFVLIKEGDGWKIADISPYKPQTTDEE